MGCSLSVEEGQKGTKKGGGKKGGKHQKGGNKKGGKKGKREKEKPDSLSGFDFDGVATTKRKGGAKVPKKGAKKGGVVGIGGGNGGKVVNFLNKGNNSNSGQKLTEEDLSSISRSNTLEHSSRSAAKSNASAGTAAPNPLLASQQIKNEDFTSTGEMSSMKDGTGSQKGSAHRLPHRKRGQGFDPEISFDSSSQFTGNPENSKSAPSAVVSGSQAAASAAGGKQFLPSTKLKQISAWIDLSDQDQLLDPQDTQGFKRQQSKREQEIQNASIVGSESGGGSIGKGGGEEGGGEGSDVNGVGVIGVSDLPNAGILKKRHVAQMPGGGAAAPSNSTNTNTSSSPTAKRKSATFSDQTDNPPTSLARRVSSVDNNNVRRGTLLVMMQENAEAEGDGSQSNSHQNSVKANGVMIGGSEKGEVFSTKDEMNSVSQNENEHNMAGSSIMDSDEELVRKCWKWVLVSTSSTSAATSAPEFASSREEFQSKFYEKLFSIAPRLKTSVFAGVDMNKLIGAFFDAITKIVCDLIPKNDASFVEFMKDLGKKHAQYGVRESQYIYMGEALVATLKEICTKRVFTIDVERAWTKVYGTMQQLMITGAQEYESAAHIAAQEAVSDPFGTKNKDRRIPMVEVRKHAAADDCWVIIDGIVYDATNFINEHPGGGQMILQYAGRDATAGFAQAHDSETSKAYNRILDFKEGVLD